MLNHKLIFRNSKFLHFGCFLFGIFLSLCSYQNSQAQGIVGTDSLPKKYAFIVGISNYQDSVVFPRLMYAKDDAERFENFLRSEYVPGLIGRIDRYTTDSISDSDISYAFTKWYGEVKPILKPGDQVFIYWSGHAFLTQTSHHFACWNTTKDLYTFPQDIDVSGTVTMNIIHEAATRIGIKDRVNIYIIVDACKNKIDQQIILQQNSIDQLSNPVSDGEVYFMAVDKFGSAWETPILLPRGGVFTYFLLLGLEGAAADEIYKDNKVSYLEIKQFLGRLVPKYVIKILNRGPQLPKIVKSDDGQNDITISNNIPDSVIFRNKYIADSIFKIIQQGVNNQSLNLSNERSTTKKSQSFSNFHKSIEISPNRRKLFQVDTFPLYRSFLNAISLNKLMYPPFENANYFYEQLKKQNCDDSIITEARRIFSKALEEKTTVFLKLYFAGKFVQAKKQQFDTATEEMKLLISLRPVDDPFSKKYKDNLLFLRARSLAGSNNPTDWNKGLRLIDSALNKNKTSYMYHTKGILFQNKSRYFTAIKYYDSALYFSPQWLYTKYNLMSTFNEIQEYEKSIHYCLEILSKNPAYSRIWAWLGYNYELISDHREGDDYKKAIYYNNKALQFDSTNIYAYLNLGRIFLKKSGNNISELASSKYYNWTGGVKYKGSQCLSALGKMYADVKFLDYDSAEHYYKLALKINKYDTSAIIGLSLLLFSQNKRIEADSLFLQILLETNFDYKYYSKFREYLFRTRSPKDADNIFTQIIEKNSEDPYVFISHSRDYEYIGNISKAAEILHLGLSKIDSSPSLNYAMAKLYFSNSTNNDSYMDSSLFYLKNLQLINPNYSLLNDGFYRYYLETGQKDSAFYYKSKSDSVNAFVEYTSNFNYSLKLTAKVQIQMKNFTNAIQIYKKNIFLSDKKFQPIIDIAKSYYLANNLSLALTSCKSAKIYFGEVPEDDDIETDSLNKLEQFNVRVQKKLKALIYFDLDIIKRYKQANRIFRSLDGNRQPEILLLRALSYFMIGKKEKSITLIQDRSKFKSISEKILGLEGIEYSTNLVQKMRIFLSDIKY